MENNQEVKEIEDKVKVGEVELDTKPGASQRYPAPTQK